MPRTYRRTPLGAAEEHHKTLTIEGLDIVTIYRTSKGLKFRLDVTSDTLKKYFRSIGLVDGAEISGLKYAQLQGIFRDDPDKILFPTIQAHIAEKHQESIQ